MTQPAPYLNPDPQLVNGLDADAIAAAVRGCAGVDDLDAGQLGSVASYLPGRTVAGVKVEATRVTVQVRTRWSVTIHTVETQIRAALTPVISRRTLDIVVSDIADPPAVEAAPAPAALPAGSPSSQGPEWTTNNDVYGGPTSAPTTPTGAETPTSSPSGWPPSTSSTGRTQL